ncbi:MAG: hypothetical protein K8F25_13545 [Fimbriimonadaceae bacterium]|nr:hypothetical protein [Alphaproteobacteria bacterium]
MRADEKFVMDAIVSRYSGHYGPGENPPDAYLTVLDETVAVEITTLTQHVTDSRGTRPRLSDDLLAIRIANGLNAELGHIVPDGRTIMLVIKTPIFQARKIKTELTKVIRELVAANSSARMER